MPGHIVTVGARKHPKRILGLPKLIYENVQNTGVTFHHELIVAVAAGDEGRGGPFLVPAAEASILRLQLNGGGQHPSHTLEAKVFDDAPGAVVAQVHPVKTPADGLLDGLLTGDVLQMACTPEGQFVLPPGLGNRAEIEISVILSHRPRPHPAP